MVQSGPYGKLCAIQGYAYVNRFYKEIYAHLKNNGDFIKALDDQNIKKMAEENIINNIVVAYINDFESINDKNSLISLVLDRCNYKEIKQIVWFVWNSRKEDDHRLRDKIFELWQKLNSLIDFETKEGRKTASQLCHWSIFIKKIDSANKNLLLAVAPYADEDHNSYEFLKNLAKLSENQPEEVREIWMKMLDGCAPGYPKEAIETFLSNLVAKGKEGIRKAKEVVDKYLRYKNEKPFHYLHEIIEKVDD